MPATIKATGPTTTIRKPSGSLVEVPGLLPRIIRSAIALIRAPQAPTTIASHPSNVTRRDRGAEGATIAPCQRSWGSLSGGCRKRRELLDVAHVVLDDHRPLQVRRSFLQALDGRHGLRAIGVEAGHAAGFVVLAEMHQIAGQQYRPLLLQLDQQDAVAGRVAGRTHH